MPRKKTESLIFSGLYCSRCLATKSQKIRIIVVRSTNKAFRSRRRREFTVADRYAARTGRDLSNLSYYLAFNRWKSAAIIHGVYARYMAGQKSTEGIDMDEMRERISNSLILAEEAVNA